METHYRNKDDLLKELARMRAKMQEVEICHDELERYRERYDKLLNSTPDALVFVDRDSRIIMVNAQFEKLFGYREDEIIGNDLSFLIPERFRSKHHKYVGRFFQEPKSRPMGTNLEIYALKKNQEEFPVDIGLSFLQTEGDVLVSAAIRDITRRREAERQIELDYFLQKELNSILEMSLSDLQLKEQFERVLELLLSTPYLSLQSKGAIYITEDHKDKLVLKAKRGFPASSKDPCNEIPFGHCICGKAASLAEIIHVDQVDNQHTIHAEDMFPHGHYCIPITSGGQTLGLINIYIREGHKRSPKEEQFLTTVAKTLAIIIKHQRIENEKENLQNQLAMAEKFAALGRFTSNIAHEIRNPLTAIGGFARRLEHSVKEGTKDKEYAGFIASEVSVLENILKKVLTYSRSTAPVLEKGSMNEMIEGLLYMNEAAFSEKKITIKKSFGDIPEIPFDRTGVHEAIENLLINAVDSMPDGGDISIATDMTQHQGKEYIRVKISDTGSGIPQGDLDKIFEPFYTTKIAEKGTGLGLSITRKIMQDHGGFIEARSTPGEGSTFILYIPSGN